MDIVGNFNTVYSKEIDKYLDTIQKLLIPFGDFTFCETDDSKICLTKAPFYKIPEEIINFVTSSDIMKPHAHILKKGIHINLEWDNSRVRVINGEELAYGGLNHICDGCEVEITDIDMWRIDEYDYDLCDPCYDSNEKFNVHGKEKFMRSDNTSVNFLDWIEFMTEPLFDRYSTFYVNCNPASKYYGGIMVTICNDRGRQRFDTLYKNLNHMMEDIHEWFAEKPSKYSDSQITALYTNTDELGFEPEVDIPFDKQLENETPEQATQRCVQYLSSPYKYSITDAIKYGIIKEGEVFTRRMVLEHEHALKTVRPDALEKEIAEVTRLRELAIKHREASAHYKGTGKFVPWTSSGGTLGCDAYADLDISQIPEQAQKNIDMVLRTPVFASYEIKDIRDGLLKSGVYRHDCFASFTIWHRIKYNLGFYWG